MSLKVRNYKLRDESRLAEIRNTVTVEMDPASPLIKPDFIFKMKKNPFFKEEFVKCLVTQDDRIIGYSECRFYKKACFLIYPMILKEYRTEERLDMLFQEVVREAKGNNPEFIQAHYLGNFTAALEYFDRQTVIKVVNKRVFQGFSIDSENLDFEIDGFSFRPFTEDQCESVLKYNESTLSIQRAGNPFGNLSMEVLKRAFETDYVSPKKSFIIEKDGEIRGVWSINHLPDEEYQSRFSTIITPFGYYRSHIIDLKDPELNTIRKFMLKLSYIYLKERNIKKFHLHVPAESEAEEFYRNLGFQEDCSKVGQVYYFFEI